MTTHASNTARYFAATLATVCGLTLGLPAAAQNALGDGTAHDANFQQGGSRVNPRGRNANFGQEVRFRNAIVTGNAPGGASFRGDAGYLASDDFRGDTGLNTLYDFQRDSLYSGLATRGIRNIDALRAQMSLATGGAPTYDTGGLFIQRAGAGTSVADIRFNQPQLSIDPFTSRIGSMRSTSAYIGAQSIEPQFFGSTRDQNGEPYAIGSSPLRGLIAQPLLVAPESPQSPLPELPGMNTVPVAGDQRTPGAAGTPGGPNAAQPATGGLTFNPNDLGAGDDEEESTPRPGQVNQTPQSNRISGEVDPQNLGTNAISNRVPARSAYDSIMAEFQITADEEPDAPAPTRATMPQIPQPGDEAEEPTAEQNRSFLERVEQLRREILGLPAEDDADEPERLDIIDPEAFARLGV
ncbi:MAG: hypothetical protein ACTS27_04920, partial [Phycisphaerales bacterium]